MLGAPEVLLGEPVAAAAAEHERAGRRVLVFGSAARVDAGGEQPAVSGVEPVALAVFEEHLRDDAAATIAYL